MNDLSVMTADQPPTEDVCQKIARLVEERGWNQEDFARIAGLNRHTVRTLLRGSRKTRNATVQSAARALGLTVSELKSLPLDRLLQRSRAAAASGQNAAFEKLRLGANRPELVAWIERNEERAGRLTADEVDELLQMQAETGPMALMGVARLVDHLERRRELLRRVRELAATEHLETLEKIVQLMAEKSG